MAASIHLGLTESERITGEVFLRLASAADEFEGYTHPHATRIARLADEVARLFHLAQQDRLSLRIAALAHDLGEVAMERDYIKRKGTLSEDERLDLARHPVIGEQEAARSGANRGAQLLVRWHQEWWDGTGYPDALRREQIPLGARILRVADAYASLTDARPYRPARTQEEALKHLVTGAGLEFDPQVVHAFISLSPIPELKSYAKTPEAAPPPPEEVDGTEADGEEADGKEVNPSDRFLTPEIPATSS
jgi:HD-GYP domain-containing protein (c-di-GMP phosphodiesterase class II)